MKYATCTGTLALLLFAAAPLRAAAITTTARLDPTVQDLERKARETLGEAVEKKASEIAARLRAGGGQGTGGQVVAGEGDEDGDEVDPAADPLLARLTAIDERLCAIEALLAELSSRSGVSAPPAATATPAAATMPTSAAGKPVTAGFVNARVRTWHHSKDVTVKLTINGLPVGRFDSDTNFDLAPFLQPGRANQLAFALEPRGKTDPSGFDLYVEAQMPGSEEYTAILQFKATKERLADTLEIPWASR